MPHYVKGLRAECVDRARTYASHVPDSHARSISGGGACEVNPFGMQFAKATARFHPAANLNHCPVLLKGAAFIPKKESPINP
jgi:hypothetical protein